MLFILAPMREIEVKGSFAGTYEELQQKLVGLGAQSEKEVQQNDTIFLPKGTTFGDITRGMPVLRIRDENGEAIFTIKQKTENLLTAIELETKVDSATDFVRMLDLMNYAPVMELKKHRTLYKLEEFELCADEVEGLGVFIEVEQIADESADVDVIQARLWEFLARLGVKTEDRVTKGYDNLLWRKQNSAN